MGPTAEGMFQARRSQHTSSRLHLALILSSFFLRLLWQFVPGRGVLQAVVRFLWNDPLVACRRSPLPTEKASQSAVHFAQVDGETS